MIGSAATSSNRGSPTNTTPPSPSTAPFTRRGPPTTPTSTSIPTARCSIGSTQSLGHSCATGTGTSAPTVGSSNAPGSARNPAAYVPDDVAMVRFWDLAATPKSPGSDPDFTVGALVARDRDGVYHLIDIVRFRDTPATVERTVRETAERDGRAVRVHIEQEPGAAGKALMHHYRTRVLDGYTLRAESPSGSKLTRAQPVAAHAEAGYLTIVNGRWNDAFLDEAELFPDGAHDDQIDALSGAIAALASRPTRSYDRRRPLRGQRRPRRQADLYTDGPRPLGVTGNPSSGPASPPCRRALASKATGTGSAKRWIGPWFGATTR